MMWSWKLVVGGRAWAEIIGTNRNLWARRARRAEVEVKKVRVRESNTEQPKEIFSA